MKCFSFLMILFFTACSSQKANVNTVQSRTTIFNVQRINLLAVEYRAPEYAPADLDDFSQNNRTLGCEPPSLFYADFLAGEKAKTILSCLNSIKEGMAKYDYQFQARPSLKIQVEENEKSKPTDCLKTALPEIPLPREIYFLGYTTDGEKMDCYSSSFSAKEKTFLDTGLLKKKLAFEIPFPLSRKLKNEKDLQLWLTVTTFDLLREDEGIRADVVTEMVCNQCFKNDRLFQEKKSQQIPPVFYRATP